MVWSRIKKAIGMTEGGAVRGALESALSGLGIGESKIANEAAFTAAVIALSAKMAKADGVTTPIEVETFERMFKPPEDELENVRRLFELATRDVAGFESYARQIARRLEQEPQLLRDVYDGLFHIAAADGILHANEELYLKRVGEIFGYDKATYRSIRALFVLDPDDPYAVLGISRDASDEELKTHYRALVREHHPDALASRGVPGRFQEMATRKLAAITTAYREIVRERGLS